jgi:hypothetical protein
MTASRREFLSLAALSAVTALSTVFGTACFRRPGERIEERRDDNQAEREEREERQERN